jgi:hypothetical protein
MYNRRFRSNRLGGPGNACKEGRHQEESKHRQGEKKRQEDRASLRNRACGSVCAKKEERAPFFEAGSCEAQFFEEAFVEKGHEIGQGQQQEERFREEGVNQKDGGQESH